MRATAVFLLVLGHLTLCHGWQCTQGPPLNKGSRAAQVDASLGQVVATDTNRQAYSLSGYYWNALPYANLKHVSVGQAGIWGIDASDRIFKYVGGSWAEVPGRLIQIDAGGNGFVVGANVGNQVYCLGNSYTMGFNGHGDVAWTEVGYTEGWIVRYKYFSCGPYGCWGVNSADQIYFKPLRFEAACSFDFEGWKHIEGRLKMIEVGSDGLAFGVNSNGHVYERTGISEGLPEGSGWQHISCLGTMTQVSYDLGTIYGVSTNGVIVKATA